MTGTAVRPRRRSSRAELDALAQESGLHPETVRRLIALGLLDPGPFPRDAASRLARAMRLRRDLGLNYAGAVLACDLLDRIERLELRLRALELLDHERR